MNKWKIFKKKIGNIPNLTGISTTFANPTVLCRNMEIRAQQTFYNRKEHKRRAHNNFCKRQTGLLARVKTLSLPRGDKNNLMNLFAKEVIEEKYPTTDIWDTSKEIAIGSRGARNLLFREKKKVMIQVNFFKSKGKMQIAHSISTWNTHIWYLKNLRHISLLHLKKKVLLNSKREN